MTTETIQAPTRTEQRVAKAEARVRRLIEAGAREHDVICAQEALDRARARAEVGERRARERLVIKHDVDRQQARGVRADARKRADAAEAELRASGMAPRAEIRYGGVTVHVDLERLGEQTARMTARADLDRVLALVVDDFQRAAGAVRCSAMGTAPAAAPWPTDKLVAHIKDVARRGLAAGSVTVCARHSLER